MVMLKLSVPESGNNEAQVLGARDIVMIVMKSFYSSR